MGMIGCMVKLFTKCLARWFYHIYGHSIRDYVTYPISKFFTLSALYLEYAVPFLLFIPFIIMFLDLF